MRPWFVHETSFLDWYERWLDEVIRGDLRQKNPGSFGTTVGGSDLQLVERYRNALDTRERVECLKGLVVKATLGPEALRLLETACAHQEREVRRFALRALTKADYHRAEHWLREACAEDALSVFQNLIWYAEGQCGDWLDEGRARLEQPGIGLEEFRFATYVLGESGADAEPLLAPYRDHADKAFRSQAEYIIAETRGQRSLWKRR